MTTARGALLAFVTAGMLSLLAASCRLSWHEPSKTDEQWQSELDFLTGDVQGTVVWNGAPVEPQSYVLYEAGVLQQWFSDSGYQLQHLPPGSHAVGVFEQCYWDPTHKVGEVTFTVTAGSMTTANIDLTATAGRVTGSIRVNGAPLADARVVMTPLGGTCGGATAMTDGSGAFSRLLAPNSYTADVFGSAGVIGSFSFVVEAGATTARGDIAFQSGIVQGTVVWNGAPVEPQSYVLYEAGAVQQWFSDSSYQLQNLATGSHTVGVFAQCYWDPSHDIGQVTFTVAADSTTTANIDLTATAGRVTGSIRVNGAPLADARVVMTPLGGTCGGATAMTDGNGAFSRLLAPNSYTADVFGSAGVIGSFSFVVEAGATTARGDIAFQSGDVQGTVVWNGAPVEPQSYVLYEAGAVQQWFSDSSYQLQNLATGSHTVGVFEQCYWDPTHDIGQVTFTVAAGSTTTANIDLTATAGRVTGSIRVNAAPLADARVVMTPLGGTCGGATALTDGGGAFSRLLAPNSYTADVFGSAGVIGSFSFAVLAGKVTNVDSLTGPFPSDPHVDLLGGPQQVNGLSLDFSEVTEGGSTTVVESGSCADPEDPCSPPPSGYEVVGARYWDINTTARYTGSIQVCIHYDAEELCGQGRLSCAAELTLRLVHDDGVTTCMDPGGGTTPWCNITSTTDRTRKIICGSTNHLSPFAIIVPLATSNAPPAVSVPGSMVVEASGPAGAAVSFNASAVDPEDGALAPACSPAPGTTFPIGTTTVTCAVTDSGGSSSSDTFTVTVRDATPPSFEGGGNDIIAYATSTAGATVTYPPPAATDAVSGGAPVLCTPSSGSRFPPGKTPVTCTASDEAGNTSRAIFTVWVQYQAPTDGTFFGKPIRPDGSSRFKIGRAVPVKFQLAGASAAITNLNARLTVTRTSNAVRGTVDCDGDEDGEDTDLLFKYRKAKGLYGYRWKTRGETPGTYRLRANLGDGVAHEIDVSLKAPR